MGQYVLIEPDKGDQEYWPWAMRGKRVRQTGGIRAGRVGFVAGWARSARADRHWKAEHGKPVKCVYGESCDALVDNEGPVINWDGGPAMDWFPGQSMGILEPEPSVPEGATLLTADQAVEAIVQGDHPEAESGGVVMDASLVEAIRAGEIVCARLSDGRLAFTKAEGKPVSDGPETGPDQGN